MKYKINKKTKCDLYWYNKSSGTFTFNCSEVKDSRKRRYNNICKYKQSRKRQHVC